MNAESTRGQVYQGLSAQEIEQNRRLHGSNSMTPPARDPAWKQFLSKFDDATIKIRLVAAAISLVMALVSKFVLHGHGGFVDGIGILVAVSLATTVAYLNERKSNREFEILNAVKEEVAIKVTRGGVFQKVSIKEIVVGDVVHLSLGDKIPTDGVLLVSLGLTVDESLLTGEARPVEKAPAGDDSRERSETAFPRDRVYRGTYVVDGHGVYRTTAVGDKTEMGKIAQELGDDEDDTPLKQKLTVLAGQISLAGTVAALLIFLIMAGGALWRWEGRARLLETPVACLAIGFGAAVAASLLVWRVLKVPVRSWRGLLGVPVWLGVVVFAITAWGFTWNASMAIDLLNQLFLAFVVAVTVVVVAVPEGLPMMVNVSLALNMRKMARENCLVRKLVASETIGSATVVCTDKTGTLTQNRMRPVWFYIGGREFAASEIGQASARPEWSSLVENIAINSIADLVDSPGGRGVAGNLTEGALLELVNERGVDYRQMRRASKVVHQLD